MAEMADSEWQEKLSTEILADDTLTNVLCEKGRVRANIHLGSDDYASVGKIYSCKGTNINGRFQNRGRTYIGRYCAFGAGLNAISSNHRTDMINMNIKLQRQLGSVSNHRRGKPIIIGHNVWGGTNVSILGGVTIGSGAVLAAGAVVTRDVHPFEIVGGVAARHIAWRFKPKVIEALLEIGWWNWSIDRMKRNKKLFDSTISPDQDFDIMSIIQN